MNAFYPLRVLEVRSETADSVSISLEPESEDAKKFAFEAGQYLTLRTAIDGQEIRRSYSICSAPLSGELRVAIKRVPKGLFSNWAGDTVQKGDVIEVMPPAGNFVLIPDSVATRHHVAFVAGSGITPVLSQIQTVLEQEPLSTFSLFYVNRDTASIIFRMQLQELKDIHLDRFRLFHLLTREPVDTELFYGRLDQERCTRILDSSLIDADSIDAAYLCGPEAMIWGCQAALLEAGLDASKIKFELFTSSRAEKDLQVEEATAKGGERKTLGIVLDGITTIVEVMGQKTIMDAALDNGLDAPFSCLGGVCCTCRAKLTKGAVQMDANYALEPSEVEAGFVLACQSRLIGEGPFEIDFDQQ